MYFDVIVKVFTDTPYLSKKMETIDQSLMT